MSEIVRLSGNDLDVYFFPPKRCRISAPFVVTGTPKLQPSIDILPDECLYEIFRRLPGSNERSACACVSKHWLMLLSTIGRDEICAPKDAEPEMESKSVEAAEAAKLGDKDVTRVNSEEQEFEDRHTDGYLSRSLEGKKATDLRLASIAVGTAARGGLGKLSIRGSKTTYRLTNRGLKAVARGCPSLKVLSLWNLHSIGDEGLCEIAHGCHLLEKLDLSNCPGITDRGLVKVAMNCLNLKSVTLESCAGVGNESLKALSSYCPNLKTVSIRSCPLVSDQGIGSLFSSAGHILEKARFEALNISDVSLAVIGHYGTALLDLALADLQNVKERGFWVMGKAQGLRRLKSLSITSCPGVSDLGLQVVAEGCPDLKLFSLGKCPSASDRGLITFTIVARSLETLKLNSCNGITQSGVFGLLANCGHRLSSLSLENCLGMKDLVFASPLTSCCGTFNLRSLAIVNCPGFGDIGLSMFAGICSKLTHLNLSGLPEITDLSVIPLVQSSDVGLVKVNLSGCCNLTDNVIISIADLHGETLEVLDLDGCQGITDTSLTAIATNCSTATELNVSLTGITDSGIASLAAAPQLNLQVFSLQGCPHVTDKSLPFLATLGKSLLGLNIQHCKGITSGSIDTLLDDLWRCHILF